MERLQDLVCADSNAKGELLFATDFREGAQQALEFAKHVARLRRYAVRVIHVLELSKGRASFAADEAAAERSLRQISHELRLAGLAETATLIAAGHASQAICEAAAHYGTQLLVLGLGNHCRGKKRGVGSTAREILRQASCPVCTVGASAAIENSHAERTLIVTDREEASLQRSREAWPEKPEQRRVRAVLPPVAAGSGDPAEGRKSFSKVQALERSGAEEAVLREAGAWKPSLIVLSLAARGYLDSFAANSFAGKVLSEASCPVMVLRGTEADAS